MASPRSRLALAAGASALVGFALAACPPPGTSLFVLVQLDPALQADQLSFLVEKSGDAPLGPVARPEQAGDLLAQEQSVRLIVPDSYAGPLTVRVEALHAGSVVGTGSAQPLARVNSETSVAVDVLPGSCNATSCASGCCASGLCRVNDLAFCGSSGGACGACDATRADRCSGGQCLCGASPVCGPGQRCENAQCVCDATSCPGCCQGNACEPGDAGAACGVGGAACAACGAADVCLGGACGSCLGICPNGCCSGTSCIAPGAMSRTQCGQPGTACVACDPVRSDSCLNGACACGTGAECPAGLACVGGVCRCNAASCRTGCCSADAGECLARSFATCGVDGGACRACDPTFANNCSSTGTCACGTGTTACGAGSFCDAGTCECNAQTCPNGCCQGGACRVAQLSACGNDGGVCALTCNATRSNQCTNGQCRCGTNPQCAAGQRCSGGNCVCDATSCATGCCVGNVCQGATFPNCRPSDGGACQSCDLASDSCAATGTCTCGTLGAPCPAGQQCVGGACQCNATSCPTGCCGTGGVCEPGRLKNVCGTGGVNCQNCNGGGNYCDAGYCAF